MYPKDSRSSFLEAAIQIRIQGMIDILRNPRWRLTLENLFKIALLAV
jgi:hypothetical protein